VPERLNGDRTVLRFSQKGLPLRQIEQMVDVVIVQLYASVPVAVAPDLEQDTADLRPLCVQRLQASPVIMLQGIGKAMNSSKICRYFDARLLGCSFRSECWPTESLQSKRIFRSQ
jgi:hypothetical protein